MTKTYPIALDRPTKPGFFITGTDTGVGKTLLTCALASCLKTAGHVGLWKPFATDGTYSGILKGGETFRTGVGAGAGGALVSEDALALASFASDALSLTTQQINPLCWAEPLAPAVAAQVSGNPTDWAKLNASLAYLDQVSDLLLVEGIGGLLVPLDGRDTQMTVLDLILALGLPVLVVCKAGLGTLNHTAMTTRILQQAGCAIAGLVVNGDEQGSEDLAIQTNVDWLGRLTGVPVLAALPGCDAQAVDLKQGRLPNEITQAINACQWMQILQQANRDMD